MYLKSCPSTLKKIVHQKFSIIPFYCLGFWWHISFKFSIIISWFEQLKLSLLLHLWFTVLRLTLTRILLNFWVSFHRLLQMTWWSQTRLQNCLYTISYRAFHIFVQAKFPDGGLILGSSQFSVLPQLPPKTMLSFKEVKIDTKISNSLC